MKRISLCLILLCSFTLYRCEWDLEPVPACPILDSGLDYFGGVGSILTISGQHFGITKSDLNVFVGDVQFPVDPSSNITEEEIKVIVPSDADDGLIRVCIDGCCSDEFGPSPSFLLSRISVTAIAPTRAKHSETITITGSNFKTGSPDRHLVFFPDLPDTPVNPISVSNAQTLEVEVPVGAGTGAIRVELDNSPALSPEFTYLLSATVRPFYGDCNDPSSDCGDPNFRDPYGIAVNSLGEVFVTDQSDHQVYKIDPSGFTRVSFAGHSLCLADCHSTPRTGANARFSKPFGIAVDGSNNLYVVDRSNKQVRKVTSSAKVSDYAGSPGTANCPGDLLFTNPRGVAIDGDIIYVSDFIDDKIYKINPGAPTIVEDYTGTDFEQALGMDVDGAGKLYVADAGRRQIITVNTEGSVEVFAGTGEQSFLDEMPRREAAFLKPVDVKLDSKGNIFVLDQNSNKIMGISATGWVYTLAGTGASGCNNVSKPGLQATLDNPTSIALSPTETSLYVTELGSGTVKEIQLK